MDSEEQQMLLKISQLAGQINRRKNTQNTDSRTNNDTAGSIQHPQASTFQGWKSSRGAYNPNTYARGRQTRVHRNQTLVLNGTSSGSVPAVTRSSTSTHENEVSDTMPSWVAKSGRHLQLINSSVYKKEASNRARALEETRKLKLKQRDDREKAKLFRHIQRMGSGGPPIASTPSAPFYEIEVEGVMFKITNDGGKLVKVMEGPNSTKTTPKRATIGGVKFHRTRNGNMYRSGFVKAHHKIGAFKKVNELCKAFCTTGSCLKGPRCRYIHDPAKVAICKEFLHKGSCPSGDSCDLSHDLTPERTLACLHFAKGNCSKDNCRYSHVRVSPSALVCRSFGIYGFCDKGIACEERHVHECPDYSNTGKCNTKGCKLPHRHKASVLRAAVDDENSDMSSDDVDEESDNDVDSEDLDKEFSGDESANADYNFLLHKDFVQFS